LPTLAVNSPTHDADPTEVDNGWVLFLLAEEEPPPKLEPQFRVPALPVRTCPCPLSRVGMGWTGDKMVVLLAVLVVDVTVSEEVERE